MDACFLLIFFFSFCIKAGLYVQVVVAVVVGGICIIALTVSTLQEHSAILFHLTVFAGAATCFLQFFVFGGLSKGKYAHSSYYRENEATTFSSNSNFEKNHKSESNKLDGELDSIGDDNKTIPEKRNQMETIVITHKIEAEVDKPTQSTDSTNKLIEPQKQSDRAIGPEAVQEARVRRMTEVREHSEFMKVWFCSVLLV
jgi:hypothetical protein